MAAPTPPTITISPAAAQVAGCSASCTISGPTIDSFGHELYECSFAATAHGNYNFVRFTWRQSKIVYHKTDGTTTDESFDISTIYNPTDPAYPSANIGISESRYSKTTWDVMNVTAYFEEIPTTYTITTAVSPAGAGSVTGGGQYSSGTTVTLQALPNAGYGVAYWQKDGVMVQGSERQSSLSITVTSNATYTAVLQTETKVTVALVADGFGLVHFKDDSAAPSQGPIIKTFTHGSMYSDSFTVEAITKNGSVFKYWTISGSSGKWYDAELYRYAPDEDITITAYFALPIEAYARQFDNRLIPAGDPCPNGEVRIVAGSETTDWGQHVYLEITEAIEVTVEQRSTGGGWSLVYFKTIDMANGQVITSFGQVWRNNSYRDHGYIVNALFSRSPTNLLVNSSTVESPAKLVYDPATNLLVADY